MTGAFNLQGALRHAWFRFDALKDGLSSSLVAFLEDFKNDTTRRVSSGGSWKFEELIDLSLVGGDSPSVGNSTVKGRIHRRFNGRGTEDRWTD